MTTLFASSVKEAKPNESDFAFLGTLTRKQLLNECRNPDEHRVISHAFKDLCAMRSPPCPDTCHCSSCRPSTDLILATPLTGLTIAMIATWTFVQLLLTLLEVHLWQRVLEAHGASFGAQKAAIDADDKSLTGNRESGCHHLDVRLAPSHIV